MTFLGENMVPKPPLQDQEGHSREGVWGFRARVHAAPPRHAHADARGSRLQRLRSQAGNGGKHNLHFTDILKANISDLQEALLSHSPLAGLALPPQFPFSPLSFPPPPFLTPPSSCSAPAPAAPPSVSTPSPILAPSPAQHAQLLSAFSQNMKQAAAPKLWWLLS